MAKEWTLRTTAVEVLAELYGAGLVDDETMLRVAGVDPAAEAVSVDVDRLSGVVTVTYRN